jgi:hypothetical protein
MKKLLGDLAALSARTDSAERRIHDRAVGRNQECTERMGRRRPAVATDPEAAKEYQRLAMEQGKIAQVIGLARQRMS